MKVGDRIRVLRVPPSVNGAPDEIRNVFVACVGRVFPIVDIRDGLFGLEVGEVSGRPAHEEGIWIEPECAEPE